MTTPLTVYDRYMVSIPGDLYDDLEGLGQQAIVEAEARTKLFCIPALWTATLVSGEVGDFSVTFRVVRKRYKK